MKADQYRLSLGTLMQNLHGLEFALRGFLYNVNSPKPGDPSLSLQLHTLQVGQVVPLNAITDYRTLGKLVRNYNDLVAKHDPSLRIDDNIVTLRDAIGHGRVSTPEPEPEMLILKFGKPKGGSVKVSYASKMTVPWFKEQINLVYSEIMKVARANNELTKEPMELQ